MEGKGNQYAVAALKQKRAELAGEIAAHENAAKWKRHQLEQLDATLAIFTDTDPNTIKPIKPYKRVPLFKQGELAQLVRDALRRGRKPMRLSEVVESITAELGYRAEAVPAMRHRVRASLWYLMNTKRTVQKHGKGYNVRYSLTD